MGKTLIVDNIDSAVKISKAVRKYKIVTLDGDVINPGGTITGGSYKSKISNVFTRKRQLSELEDKVLKLGRLTVENEKVLEGLKNKIEDINERLKINSTSIEEMKLMQLKQENTVMNIKNQGQSLGISMHNLKGELEELESELDDMEDSVLKKELKIKELESENLSLQDNIKKETVPLLINKRK